jgi:tRNA dimethylallyltransferase
MDYDLITILGPTATGKTHLAARLAYSCNGEIISADSRQVYRGMDIGTGKDLNDYFIDGKKINYHLIDIADPKEEFNLFNFKQLFYKSYNQIKMFGKIPFLVGGTGLYLSAVIQNYSLKAADRSNEKIRDLESLHDDQLLQLLKSKKYKLHNITDSTDRSRMIEAILIADSKRTHNINENINSFNLGVSFPREEIKKRITERLRKRLREGMIEEVETLINKGISYEKLTFFGLEYKYISFYLKGELNYNDLFQKLNSAIHNFAKRQMTWFRKMEKEGVKIFWINGNDFDEAKKILDVNFFS